MAASIQALGARLGKCEVCCEAVARYRCPRCAVRSCSLPCVKRHKLDRSCNGLRDKTAYISVKQFTDLNLLSDYRFLEELGRTVDNASREAFQQNPRFRGQLPYWLHRLVVECRRREINLLIMPHNFTRRKQNTTVFVNGSRKIFWHVEWQFPQADTSYTDRRVPEDVSLSEALEKYLSPSVANEDVRHRLAFYQSAGYNKVTVLMKLEFKQKKASSDFYTELKISKSLMWNLYKKTIVEFPTIIVTLKDHAHIFPLSVSDAEDDSDEDDEPAASPVKCTSAVPPLNMRLNTSRDDANEPNSFPDCPISDLSDDDNVQVTALQAPVIKSNVQITNELGESIQQDSVVLKSVCD